MSTWELTPKQIREIQRTICLIKLAYIEGHISKEVADEACNMLQNRLHNDSSTKCGVYYYVSDISELIDLNQKYYVVDGTVCCVLNIGKLYVYLRGEWIEL